MSTTNPTHVRHRVVLVTMLMAVLLYLDRFCISFAEVFIQEDLRLTDTQVGWMLSAFFWTYAFGQVPSGWLSDRFGARRMLVIYILFWSLFTGLTGAVGVFSALLALRLGFGLGQAGAYPTSANLISKWVPFSRRGTASSMVAVGGRVGGALAPILTAFLIVAFVPTTTRSLLEFNDLLDVPRFCYELKNGSESPQSVEQKGRLARVGAKIRSRLSSESHTLVERLAERSTDDIVWQGTSPTQAEVKPLVRDLNGLIRERQFFGTKDIEGLSLSREAKELLSVAVVDLNQSQIERLNRLLLEAIYRTSIKKIYGAGWRYVMYTYGLVGLLVALFFWLVARDRPADHPYCNQAELNLIRYDRPTSSTSPDGRVGAVPLVQLVKSRSMWLSCLMQWCTNVGWVFLVTWLPRYLDTVHQVPVERRGFLAFLPLVVGWIGMVLGGRLTDWLVKRIGLRWGRALPMSASKLLAMTAYGVCLFEPSVTVAVIAFSVVAFATDLGNSAGWAYMQDVGGPYVGSVLGWGNMWGNLGAAVTPPLLIWIVVESPTKLSWLSDQAASQNWNLAFMICAAAYLIAGLSALGIDATIPIASEDQ